MMVKSALTKTPTLATQEQLLRKGHRGDADALPLLIDAIATVTMTVLSRPRFYNGLNEE